MNFVWPIYMQTFSFPNRHMIVLSLFIFMWWPGSFSREEELSFVPHNDLSAQIYATRGRSTPKLYSTVLQINSVMVDMINHHFCFVYKANILKTGSVYVIRHSWKRGTYSKRSMIEGTDLSYWTSLMDPSEWFPPSQGMPDDKQIQFSETYCYTLCQKHLEMVDVIIF